MDLVYSLIHVKRFFKYSYEEKIALKNKGRPLPDIAIETAGVSRGKVYKRQFNKDIYLRNNWICGCNKTNALFCFPCLLFGGDKAWAEVGVTDLVHLTEKIKKHDNSKKHLHNAMELAVLGTTNIRAQLDSAYWINIQKHNDNVTKNRYVLYKIINCIKFCGAFDLALRGHDKTDTSQNLGIFGGLINFSAELDATLSEHLQNASVIKGTSKEIQNDLLDCILEVCHEEITKEINKASFLAVMVDETTDVLAKSQLVVILRYTLDGELIERFWKYLNPAKCDAKTLSENILSVVDPLVENSPYKLIAQSYDGAVVMSGQHAGVQAKIIQKYPYAYFVHCYAHKLNLIMSKAASINSQVRVFFENLKEVPAFFNNSPQRVEVLNTIVRGKIPQGATTHWNFNIRTINIVFENRDSLIECMEKVEEQFNNETVCSAASFIRRMLEDSIFVFWLTFFHHVMPHIDILFNQLQKRKSDPTQVKHDIDNFEKNINHIRNNIDDIITEASNICTEPQEKKRKRSSNSRYNHRIAALEVCDLITNSAKDRFMFKDHLLAASLFYCEHFGEYCGKFPEEKLTTTCLIYPTLEKERLRTELSIIYLRNDCRGLNGVLPLLKFIIQNRLEETLRETKKLLEILATTPMPTSEAERCLSTLKRIKTFLRNTISQDRLTALSMLSIEKSFISKIDNFNEKVIEKFASREDRRIEFSKNRNNSSGDTVPANIEKSLESDKGENQNGFVYDTSLANDINTTYATSKWTQPVIKEEPETFIYDASLAEDIRSTCSTSTWTQPVIKNEPEIFIDDVSLAEDIKLTVIKEEPETFIYDASLAEDIKPTCFISTWTQPVIKDEPEIFISDVSLAEDIKPTCPTSIWTQPVIKDEPEIKRRQHPKPR